MWKRNLVIGGALLHLTLVALGAAQKSPGFLEIYTDLTGTNNGFGFFAPRVASDCEIALLAEDRDGTMHRVAVPMVSKEGRTRAQVSIAFLGIEDVRDLLAASWAANAFAQRAEAKQVTLIARAYELPPPAEYAAGQRPAWQEVYRAVFVRTEVRP